MMNKWLKLRKYKNRKKNSPMIGDINILYFIHEYSPKILTLIKSCFNSYLNLFKKQLHI